MCLESFFLHWSLLEHDYLNLAGSLVEADTASAAVLAEKTAVTTVPGSVQLFDGNDTEHL
jgi:hypothetical protein